MKSHFLQFLLVRALLHIPACFVVLPRFCALSKRFVPALRRFPALCVRSAFLSSWTLRESRFSFPLSPVYLIHPLSLAYSP
ncbi:hypothetical protein EDB89DRAFT_69447 [Lactarius sanguifluus]|nr:hypothetical protein EDB89DRAFT_1083250 [Lactarius sanguifluus]KAH9180836.1 hypothetical protein EDB89DRAFT_69447 [Lactarius sanguifluus]